MPTAMPTGTPTNMPAALPTAMVGHAPPSAPLSVVLLRQSCTVGFPARRLHVLMWSSRSDVALAGGFLGRDYRSGFHSITCIPLLCKHLLRAVSLAHEPLTTLTKKRSLLTTEHHSGVKSAKEVPGDLTWSLDVMTAFYGVTFLFWDGHWLRQDSQTKTSIPPINHTPDMRHLQTG